jgi:hypothetical protein
MTVLPYAVGDVFHLHMSPRTRLTLGGMPLEALEAALLTHPACAVTLWAGDARWACWGFLLPWEGLAEGWCVVGADVSTAPVPFLRTVFRWVRETCAALNLRRVQCHVRDRDDVARRFATYLGFRNEAVLPQYGPDGETYWLKSLLRPHGGW